MKFFDIDNTGFEIAADVEALVAEELGSRAEMHFDFNDKISSETMTEIRGHRRTAMARQLDHTLLTVDEQKTCVLEAQGGCEIALDFLVRHQQKLVASVARQFSWAGQRNGLTMEDLRQEGNVGLMDAVWKWDADKGTKFSTYATLYIKSAIMKALGATTFVRLPHFKALLASRLPGLQLDLESELQRKPTGQEVLDAVVDRGLNSGFSEDNTGKDGREVLTVDKINELLMARIEVQLEGHGDEDEGEIRPWQEVVSETAQVLDDRGRTECLQDTSNPEDIAIASETAARRKEFIRWLVEPLSEVETGVLLGHTVLGMSFKELAKQDFARKKDGKARSARVLAFAWERSIKKALDHAHAHGVSQQQVRTLLTA